MEVHKVLCLPRNLRMEAHKFAVPDMEVHKVLCLPRKSALQETTETFNRNGGTIPTMIRP